MYYRCHSLELLCAACNRPPPPKHNKDMLKTDTHTHLVLETRVLCFGGFCLKVWGLSFSVKRF